MRIRLRPYHPTWVVAFFGAGGPQAGHNRRGFEYVMDAIRRDPDVEIELVEDYDDICERCDWCLESKEGSVWGKGHTCRTAQNPVSVESVQTANRQVLERLGLHSGSVIRFRDLVELLAERIPDLGQSGIAEIGSPKRQDQYAKGIAVLRALWMRG